MNKVIIFIIIIVIMFGGKAVLSHMWGSGNNKLKHLSVVLFVLFPVVFYAVFYILFIK